MLGIGYIGRGPISTLAYCRGVAWVEGFMISWED